MPDDVEGGRFDSDEVKGSSGSIFLQSNTVQLSAFILIPCMVKCFIKLVVLPALVAILLSQMLHFADSASTFRKCSHTLGLFGIVKRKRFEKKTTTLVLCDCEYLQKSSPSHGGGQPITANLGPYMHVCYKLTQTQPLGKKKKTLLGFWNRNLAPKDK